MSVKIKKPWVNVAGQTISDDDGNVWTTSELIVQSNDLPVKDVPLEYIPLDFKISGVKVREFVSHMKLIMDVDLSKPIILDQDACLFDGRHRVAKALFEELESIKAVRFEEDPRPTYTRDV